MCKLSKLESTLHERGITIYRMSKDCGIYSSDMYQAISGKKPMFPKWKKKIADYLDMNEKDLFC